MGLLKKILLLPIGAPLHGALWVADKIVEAAENEYNDPAQIRLALRALEDSLLRGEISESEYDLAEEELLIRLKVIK